MARAHPEDTPEGRPAAAQAGAGKGQPCLILAAGPAAGAARALPTGTTIVGRANDVDQRFDDPKISRRHASFVVAADGCVVLEDLGSSNGTYVNDVRITRQELQDGDRIQFGPDVKLTLAYRHEVELEHRTAPAPDLGIKDEKTTAYTETYLRHQLEADIARAKRHHLDLAVMVLAIDQLKEIGKAHGPEGQEHALKATASAVAKILRADDVLARSEQKFLVLAHDISDEGVVVLAQRIRRAARGYALYLDQTPVPMTLSIGVATLSADEVDDASALIRQAERYLEKVVRRAGANAIAGNAVKTFIRHGGSNTTVKFAQTRRA